MGLELYGQIEPLLGFDEQKERLYDIFLEKLRLLGVQSFLDVGCGSGVFMQRAKKLGLECEGIDLSQQMVERTQSKGLRAYYQDVCAVQKKYEAITAVFDVINYMDQEELKRFFGCVKEAVQSGGYFLCDINTLYGFEEIAPGAMIIDKDHLFIAVEAEYNEGRLVTDITAFFRQNSCFVKKKDTITQYYHEIEFLKTLGLNLVDIDFVSLYGDEVDKALLTFQKE